MSEQLSKNIAANDGAPAAARMMDIDLRPFEDALADKHQELDTSAA